MDKEQAYHKFWSSFGIPAYDENTVINPNTGGLPEPPYLTYDVIIGGIGDECYSNVTLWYRGSSWAGVTEKAHEIERFFGFGERTIDFDNGKTRIWLGSPKYQRGKESEDPTIRMIEMNIITENIQTVY